MSRFDWTVVMPVKVLGRAKSRLAVLAGPRRPELALALASDTVSAVLACPEVSRLLVVTSDTRAASVLSGLGAFIVPDAPDSGLNAALVYGAAEAARRWPGGGTAALAADLPALRPGELGAALSSAAASPGGSFVADAAGVGTTMYASVPGGTFAPRFEGASRARHASSGARELDLGDVPGLRRDVDTPDDLRAALSLGAGPRTTEMLARYGLLDRSASG
ncbi:MAG: 2-phospho-L-lactate guanylyltransferase [Streptosporangiales bacterium]|nr:2-phospho-L-lactate guanylyltransferase [Streptosporangiales bacterium]